MIFLLATEKFLAWPKFSNLQQNIKTTTATTTAEATAARNNYNYKVLIASLCIVSSAWHGQQCLSAATSLSQNKIAYFDYKNIESFTVVGWKLITNFQRNLNRSRNLLRDKEIFKPCQQKKDFFLHFLKTGAELKKSLTLPSVFNRLVAWNDWKWSDQLQSSTYAIWYFVIKMLIMAKGGRSIQEFLFNINQKPLSI